MQNMGAWVAGYNYDKDTQMWNIDFLMYLVSKIPLTL